MAERVRRSIERHLAEARLPPGKTIDTFDFEAVPVVSKAQVMALAAGDASTRPPICCRSARRRKEPSGSSARLRTTSRT